MFEKVLKNTFYLVISEIISKMLFLILLFFMARAYGPEGIGKYGFAFAYGAFFLIFANWGMDGLVVRELNKEKNKSKYVGTVFFLNILLGFGVLGGSIIIGYFLFDKSIFLLVCLVALLLFIDNLILVFFSIFRFYEKMFYEGLIRLFHNIFIVGISLFFVLNGYALHYVFLSFLFGKILAFFLSMFVVVFNFGYVNIDVDIKLIRRIMLKSIPFLLIFLSGVIIYKIDILMLWFFEDFENIGLYEAGQNIVRNAGFIVILFGQAFYSRFCKFSNLNKSLEFYKKTFLIYLLINILFLIIVYLFGDFLIRLIYGNLFLESVGVLRLLAFSAIFWFFNLLNLNFFNSIEKSWHNVFIFIFGAVINFIMNLFLIPVHGIFGAAFSSIISYFLVFIIYIVLIIRLNSRNRVGFSCLFRVE